MLEIRLLGTYDVRVDGRPVEMPLRAAQALLAYLLLNAGTTQRREQLAGLIWPDMTDAKAKDNLRHTLWVIRKALGNRDYLLADDLSVSFNTTLDYWLDTAALDRKTSGEESADALIAIVSAYGGGLLPGFYDDWIVLERERLQAAFERKMTLLLDKLVEAQRWPEALDWGQRWIALGQVPEPAYRALMSAHAGLGDMAGVATIHQRCVEALKTELGVEPAAQTRALYERLQREATKRVKDIAAEIEAPRHNLPAQLTSFIGREGDVANVCDYLRAADKRLVTLVGPPGIGKTRLSLQAGHDLLPDFADGVFFVPLASLTDPGLVASTVAHTLGLSETSNLRAEERLLAGIGQRRLLLILDNFEQIIEGAAPLTIDLLNACPNLKMVVTSRESLRVPGEWLYAVPSLAIPDETQARALTVNAADQFSALQLFAERARAVHPDFSLTPDNVTSVTAICGRLAGLPLAIEIIASRLRLMSPQALLTQLDASFTLHADGLRGVPPRQKSLHHAIAWSYDLLSRDEQALFAQLAVFVSGFTLEAAQVVTQTPQVIAGLTSLLEKSLLGRSVEVSSEARFSQLVMMRDFALDRLREQDGIAALRDRHLAYYLDLAERADREIHGPQQVEWLDRLEKEIDNFRAALDWCVLEKKPEAGLRLLGALGWPWIAQGHESDLRSWFDTIRALPEIDADPLVYGRLLNQLGRASWRVDDFRDARSVLEESRAIWLKLGVAGESGLADALIVLGMVARNGDADYPTAQSLFEQSLELSQKHQDRWGAASALFNLGVTACDQHDDTRALPLLKQSWDLFHQLGDAWGLARVSQWLGYLSLKKGDYEKARQLFEQQLMIDEELHFRPGIVVALGNLGELYRYQGEDDRATEFHEKSLVMSRAYGLKGDWGYSVYALGVLALHNDDYALARERFIDYFGLTWPLLQKPSACDFLTSMAAVAAGTNQPERAARWHGAAQAVLATTDYRIQPFDQAEFDRHLQIAREQLGETAFEALAAEGRVLTLDQAITEALEADG